MLEALQINIEAMDRAHEIVKFDRQTLGFDIDIWLTVMRGQTLVMLGRGQEARPFLDRIIQLDSSQVDALHYGIPSWAYVDLAWAEGNIGLAREHADRAFSIAMKAGNPYLRVYAQALRGVSHIVAGRLTSAIEDLSEALSFARSQKAGLENEPRILADLANAYRLNGDTATALATVDEAIKIATERHARVPECLARIVRADLLLRSTSNDEKAEGAKELESAKALMRETGAMLLESFFKATGDANKTAVVSTRAG
jgi:adenylate cyclase